MRPDLSREGTTPGQDNADTFHSSVTSKAQSDRAVSDLVGFILTFSIIMTSVVLVSTVGFAQLDDFKTNQQLDNAESAFEIFANSFDSIEEGGAIIRQESLDLYQGTIGIERGSTATVTLNRASGADRSLTVPLHALVYSKGSTNISYESGATFRGREDGGTINQQPGFVCTDNVAVLSFVTLQSPETSASGGGALEVTAAANGTDLLYPINQSGRGSVSDVTSISVSFASAREDAWLDHFDEAANWTVSGPTAQCGASDSLDRVFVRRQNVTIEFDR
ncbi:hypothetical protein Hrd1104_02400 [Halorhabdus sp. CBA1104]|uniref:DUF7289 family protein n=1 Tax=Halorhabdus sp. CBA1104 TaxID=1380432 RepID=UPI0012B342B5|nr:hypothetical protein [Halorhabdus sp. CBA1104]QGN06252.1 hypothetical protein Hrd1104_02400 [Halorhabdus sp. CBA1104]